MVRRADRRRRQPRGTFGDGAAAGRVALPGRSRPPRFQSMSVRRLIRSGSGTWSTDMVHSVELLFDPDTEAAISRIWDDLTEAGVRSLASSKSPSNRPHMTLAVAERMDDAVDDATRALLGSFRFRARSGPRWCSGGRPCTVRLVVPSAELLALQADVHAAVCLTCHPARCRTRDPGAVDTPCDAGPARRQDKLAVRLRCAGCRRDRRVGGGAPPLGRQQPRGAPISP